MARLNWVGVLFFGVIAGGLTPSTVTAELSLDFETRALLRLVPALAEQRVDLDAFENVPKCGETKPFHNCFKTYRWVSGEGGDTPIEVVEVGFWRDNDVWEGFLFEDSAYKGHYLEGEFYGLRCGEQGKSGWYTCPNGDRQKALSGYLDANGDQQGQWRYEYASGNVYIGDFTDGQKEGYGRLIYADGSV